MKKFLLTSSNIKRSSYAWNMTASLSLAFQSVVMLIVLMHVTDLATAGIFTIAYANANLMHIIGKWGIRNFQVSDVTGVYSFKTYCDARLITSILMIVVSGIVIFVLDFGNGYSFDKTLTIGIMCLFKLIDVVEDVYTALYQKCGRLDVGAKCMALRIIITIILFALLTGITKNLLVSLVISTIVSTIILIYFMSITYPVFKGSPETLAKEGAASLPEGNCSTKPPFSLLLATMPLFIGSFLQFYIGNAPKYAIDSILDDNIQASFGFLSMPVFVIGLFASFIFTPIVHSMSVMWHEAQIRTFRKRILKQLLYILIITVACIAVGYAIGLPVLSFLYNTDLRPYMLEFIILLIAGGFLAATSLFVIVLTIIRYQKAVIVGYLIASACAFIFSKPVVADFGMRGASMLYLALMVGLTLIFAVFVLVGIKKCKTKDMSIH